MTDRYIYLAGPIAGCSQGEANDWRTYVSDKLDAMSRNLDGNIRGVSQLRCEPIVGDVYKLGYDDPKFGTSRAISSKNYFDTLNCDMVLAFFPKFMNDKRPSIGTIVECGWARAKEKKVILVTDDPYYFEHPVLDDCASWKLTDLDQALEVIEGVMSVYA